MNDKFALQGKLLSLCGCIFSSYPTIRKLTINTFSRCLLRRVYLFAIFSFFDYQRFPPSPLLRTPASVSGALHASVPHKHHSFASSSQSSWGALLCSSALEKGKEGSPLGCSVHQQLFSFIQGMKPPIKKNTPLRCQEDRDSSEELIKNKK